WHHPPPMSLRSILGLAFLLAAAGLSLSVPAADQLRGAGATFPAPVYTAWAAAYQQSHAVKVSYEAVGSCEGIGRVGRHEVDFRASAAPLTEAELASAGLVQFPVVIGGVVPVINIRGIKPGELRLSGAVLADIYLGRVRKWNAPPIAELNPALT